MSVQVLPTSPSDLPTMIGIYERAFASSFVTIHGFAQTPPPKLTAWIHSRFLNHFSRPHSHCFKAVDSSGEILGWSHWVYPHVPSPEPPEPEAEDPWPAGANAALLQAFFGGLAAMKKKWAVEQMYVVELLITDPAHQRRGVGRALLRHGLELADGEGKMAYLEASKAGKPLYESLGWKQVDMITVDLGEGALGDNWIMVREPQGRSGDEAPK